jgi:hypothetical protein
LSTALQGLLVPVNHARAAEWYVSAGAPPAASDSRKQTVWRSFAEIDWARIGPGDTLYIIGGACGPIYRETLVVGASGSSLSSLVISGEFRSGGDRAVIDGENGRMFGVIVRGRDYVTIRGLTIRNHAAAGISVQGSGAGVVVEKNSLFSGDPGGGNARGVDARNNRGDGALTVRENRFSTPERTRAQTDGIYSMNNDGVVFERNHIVVSNSDMTGHSDAFQSFQDKNIRVRGNWFEQANTASSHNHGAWMSNGREGGTIEFGDNIVLTPNLSEDSAVTHYRTSDWSEMATIRIWRNTIIGGRRALNLANSPRAEVYSNVIAPVAGGSAVRILGEAPPAGSIEGNLIWAPRWGIGQTDLRTVSWNEWQRHGYDLHGVNLALRPAPRNIRDVQAAVVTHQGRHRAGASFFRPPVHANAPLTLCSAAK